MTTGRINQVASSEDRDAAARVGASAPRPRARGVDGLAKVRRSNSFENPTKSVGTAAFTRVHEQSGVRRSERTRRETKSGGK
ncbi:hypothetical protein H6P81_015791 [Aristolochia fimbriata]|uniref:Uncharacterized protein n=1 Tax=Aristolochia fimbriata TaxID=158543 RepID=A0AAV7E9J6_ARIFI|nr:hypothetical protein H6P81_015791 [Aristolochia fimbriata]